MFTIVFVILGLDRVSDDDKEGTKRTREEEAKKKVGPSSKNRTVEPIMHR